MLVSPGGVGKTAFTFATAVACAAGDEILHDKPHRPLRVWLYNLEEPYDEMRRRLKAVCLHYEGRIRFRDIRDRLFLNSGRDPRVGGESGILNVAIKDESGAIIITPDVDKMIAEVRRLAIDVVVIDPFVMTHQVEENSNADGERVLREFNRIALEGGCAILLVHHTRKGFIPGDADSIRGASSLTGAARVAFTLAPMGDADAATFDIKPDEKRFLVRLDDAKANLAPKASDTQWIKLQSVNLGNATEEYPHGDNVQAAIRWNPPAAVKLSTSLLNEILEEIDRGAGAGDLYMQGQKSKVWIGRAFQSVGQRRGITMPEKMIKDFINDWMRNGVLQTKQFRNSWDRHLSNGLVSNPSNRPGQEHEND
jgi:hypothetical protein